MWKVADKVIILYETPFENEAKVNEVNKLDKSSG